MSDFFEFFKNLFGQEAKSGEPLVHEMIKRDEDDLQAYNLWKSSARKERVIEHLKLEYIQNKNQENITGATFYNIDQPAIKGFQLNYDQEFSTKKEFQFLFDYLRDRVLELEYQVYISDSRSFIKNDSAESIERHYLKPKLRKDADNKFVHLYGNITITHHLIDDEPGFLRFTANIYQDRKYAAAADFEELVEIILK